VTGQPEAPAIPGVTRWHRKTAETEAVQWTGENLEAIRKLAGNGSYMTDPDGTLRVLGPDGWRRVDVGWWVGREGRELFTDSEQGFARNYERVPDPLVMPADERAEYWHKRWLAAIERADKDGMQAISQHVRIQKLTARAEAAEARLAAIRVSARDSGRIVATHPDDGTYAAKEISFAAGQSRSLAEVIAAFEHSNHLGSEKGAEHG